MDTQTSAQSTMGLNHDHQDGHCCYGGHRHRFWRFLVCLLILIFVFSLGYNLGKFKETLKYSGFPSSFMGQRLGQFTNWGIMGNSGWNMMSGNVNDDLASAQLFGTVVKVDGNQITVTDNSGKTQVVLTQAQTAITMADKTVGLAAIKPGQSLTVWGVYNTSHQLVARSIDISQ